MWHPNSGQLNLLQRVDNASTSLMWTRSGPQGKAWQRGEVHVRSEDQHRFIFEAVLPSHIPGIIAIDHFELKDGYCESSDGSIALVTSSGGRLVSPQGFYNVSQHKCLRFWFFIAGRATEALNVTRVIDDQGEDSLWYGTKSHAPAEQWYSAAVDVTSVQGDATLVFEGTTSGDPGTAVAVDDISLGETACPAPGSCSFEEDMCNWQNIAGRKHASWYRHKGATVTVHSGLKKDHTLGTDEGYYLLLDSADLSETGIGIIESQTLTFGPVACVKLYYYLEQKTRTTLTVAFTDPLGTPIGSETTVTATAPTGWTLLSVESTNLPIAFTNNQRLLVRLLLLRPVPTVTQTAPTTKPSLECRHGEFDCRDGTTCIPGILLCDGVPDCPNRLDEKCGMRKICGPQEFLCITRSLSHCLPRTLLCDGKEDCAGGSDESLCDACPHSLCLNGGVCGLAPQARYPVCDCPTGYEGHRSEDCTFEDGPCNDWVSTDCNKGACFVVRKVAAMKNGPALDHTVSSEDGSCAYSAKGVTAHGTPYALISRNATAPLCFTAWYHQSGTEHEGAHFSVMKPGDYSPETFYESQREMAGRWQRVKYSERRAGAVVIQITHRVKDMPEKAMFAVDDLTVESGPCIPEPKNGPCDFDWGDDCGYNFGAGNNSWKLEDSRRDNFKPPDHSTSTVLGGVAYLGAQGDLTRASFTSPLLKGRKEVQCLRFHYYIPWSLSTPENTYSLGATIRGKISCFSLSH
ncbi:hypothetical protein HPB50_020567 [Hyalomma asiaticum]|uniref:Uncharacterized protein n=1 Tax=Hyalomma asiaticum TaxID=266040 RepID=A0ACB7SS81_HYAAI|nr:hypothetical protein HPB50_020567 [Hyalomma asiaticum]